MYQIEFECRVCSKPTIKSLPNKSSAVEDFQNGKRKAYCSKECKKQDHLSSRKYKKCSNCKCFKKYDEYEERRCGGHFKTCKKCRNKEVKEANEPDNKNIPDNTNTIIINDIIYEKLDYSRDDIINVNGDIYIKKIYHNSKR